MKIPTPTKLNKRQLKTMPPTGFGFIYLIRTPSGRGYIGQTARRITTRLHEHATQKNCGAVFNALRKYKNPVVFLLGTYPRSQLDKKETQFIRAFGTQTPNGYNIKPGGARGPMSERTKRLLSLANKGKTLTEEHKRKIGLAGLGRKKTKQQRRAQSEYMLKNSYQLKKTHCPQGHVYSKENTIVRTRTDGRKYRLCAICERVRWKLARLRAKQQENP